MVYLAVGLGGFVGALGRFLVGAGVRAMGLGGFPLATLIVNTVGCFLIGYLWGHMGETFGKAEGLPQAFLMVGVLGGFTTFSAFGLESILLLDAGRLMMATVNILLNVMLGLGAVYLGRLC